MPRRPDVTLTQLRYFVKAATYGSMTKAADELRIAQSAVSAAVSQLEHQIGTQLFIRRVLAGSSHHAGERCCGTRGNCSSTSARS